QPGIVAVGTNALLANVNGKITTKPNACTFSGASTSMPTSTGSHENARLNPTSRATAPSTRAGPVPILKPRRMPTPSRIAADQTWRTTSAVIRPASGGEGT